MYTMYTFILAYKMGDVLIVIAPHVKVMRIRQIGVGFHFTVQYLALLGAEPP